VPEHDERIALLKELLGGQLILVIRTERLLKDVDGRLLSLMPPRAGKTRVVAHPDEVVGPQIDRTRSRSPSL
jgi:hypothetical protein